MQLVNKALALSADAAFTYRCYGDPASSEVALRCSPGRRLSPSPGRRSSMLWTFPAASAAAPPALQRAKRADLLRPNLPASVGWMLTVSV